MRISPLLFTSCMGISRNRTNVKLTHSAGLRSRFRGPQARAFRSEFKFKDTYGKRFNEVRATYGCGPGGSRQRLSIPPLRDSVLTAGGELKPRSRWSGIRTSPIKGDGRIRTELAPLGRGDQALLGSTFVSWLLLNTK